MKTIEIRWREQGRIRTVDAVAPAPTTTEARVWAMAHRLVWAGGRPLVEAHVAAERLVRARVAA
jgi:hypothetical protein